MTAAPHSYRPISDYAVIGDCRTAALISRDGSIDWCCLPDFHSPAFFGRLLDAKKGGQFAIHPSGSFESRQTYAWDTNVLVTTFTAAEGVVRLTDFMPIPGTAAHKSTLYPLRQIVRCVEGIAGSVEIQVDFAPRPDYARRSGAWRSPSPSNVIVQEGSWLLHLVSERPLNGLSPQSPGAFTVHAGERVFVSLAYDQDSPAVQPFTGDIASAAMEETKGYWRRWLAHCMYSGPYQEYVERSALVLKLMEFTPSGAIVAAPTTSLPEAIGGVRNWDYRFCWLRDAAMSVGALRALGYDDEARAFLEWMLHSTRLTQPRLQVVYNVYGEASLPQRELAHLEGYRGSKPVRIGNQAADQYQLDIYGEVLEGMFEAGPLRGRLSRDERSLLKGFGDYVARHWHLPDNGIWEFQNRRQFTHSKVMSWLALHRAEQLLIPHNLDEKRRRTWQVQREEVIRQVLRQGFNNDLQSFVIEMGSRHVDAAALSYPIVKAFDAMDPRMLATVEAVRKHLTVDNLVYRYHIEDGLPSGEGAFSACTFWLAHCLALQRDTEGATEVMESITRCANHVLLLSEEVDPYSREALGNFPQALSHIGLINAAVALAESRGSGFFQ